MSRASVLGRGRRAAAEGMVDTCRITRLSDERGPMDPDTLQYDPAAATTLWTGSCRVQVRSDTSDTSDSGSGDRLVGVQRYEVHLPVAGTDHIAPGDIVEILTSQHDASLTGRKFTVRARHEKSLATARRLRVEAVTS